MKFTSFLWGIFFLLVAGGLICNAFGVLDIEALFEVDVFFDGWWTLSIIVPCIIGFFFFREKVYNLIGCIVGIGLLLCCQDVISFRQFYIYIIPAVIFSVGLKLIIHSIFPHKANTIIKNMKNNGIPSEICRGIFYNLSMDFEDDEFENAELTALFGNVICNLNRSVINEERAIKAISVFGSIDIDVPNNVNVVIRSSSIFGGVSNKTQSKDNLPNIYISCTCIFGCVRIVSTQHEFSGPWVF